MNEQALSRYELPQARDEMVRMMIPPRDLSAFLRSVCCSAPVYLAERDVPCLLHVVRCAACVRPVGARWDDGVPMEGAKVPWTT